MREELTIHTAAGAIKVGNELDFYRNIPQKLVNGRVVEVPILDKSISEVMPIEKYPAEYNYGETFISKKAYNLDKEIKCEMSHKKLYEMNAPVAGHELESFVQRYFEYETEKQIKEAIGNEFKIMVAKKSPTFFTKDLTLDHIQDLSMEHIKNYNSYGLYAFPYNMSKYQKFFVLASPEAFTFFKSPTYVQQQLHKRTYDSITLSKFCEIEPNKWVIGRYENLEYLKQLQDYSQYAINKPKD